MRMLIRRSIPRHPRMAPRPCLRCHRWWSTDIPRTRITGRICPNCIPFISHHLTYDPPGRELKAPA